MTEIKTPLWKITGTIARIEAEIQSVLDDETLTAEQRDTCIAEAFGAYEDAQEALPDKIENCARYVRALELNDTIIGTELDRINALRKTNGNKIAGFKKYLLSCLKQIEGGKLKTPLVHAYFYLKKDSRVVCDVNKLPADKRFWTPQKPKANIKGVGEVLRDGEAVPGAYLDDTEVLIIK